MRAAFRADLIAQVFDGSTATPSRLTVDSNSTEGGGAFAFLARRTYT